MLQKIHFAVKPVASTAAGSPTVVLPSVQPFLMNLTFRFPRIGATVGVVTVGKNTSISSSFAQIGELVRKLNHQTQHSATKSAPLPCCDCCEVAAAHCV